MKSMLSSESCLLHHVKQPVTNAPLHVVQARDVIFQYEHEHQRANSAKDLGNSCGDFRDKFQR